MAESPRSLVTGGAGFVASHVASVLLEDGHRVTVLDDLSGGFVENVPRGAEFVEASVTDHEVLERLFADHKFDYVYHLAAYAAEGLSHFIRRFNYTNNVIGSVNLVNEAIKNDVKCFVFTSSIAVYGANQLPMHEEMTPAPEDPYGIAKLAVEKDLRAAKEMFGLDSIIFRPHNVYGENQNIGDRYRNVVGIFINQIMKNQPLTIFGDGTQSRAFSYVDDVAPQIARSVTNKNAYNEVFNVGANDAVTLNALAEIVSAELGATPEVRHLPPRNEVVHAFSDHSKAIEVFGHIEETPLREGIAKTVAWARKHGARKTRAFRDIEIDRKLPAIWLEEEA